MIEDIVQMILKEARAREGEDSVSCIYKVMHDIENEIIGIVEVIRKNERSLEKDENEV